MSESKALAYLFEDVIYELGLLIGAVDGPRGVDVAEVDPSPQIAENTLF